MKITEAEHNTILELIEYFYPADFSKRIVSDDIAVDYCSQKFMQFTSPQLVALRDVFLLDRNPPTIRLHNSKIFVKHLKYMEFNIVKPNISYVLFNKSGFRKEFETLGELVEYWTYLPDEIQDTNLFEYRIRKD